MRFRFGQREFGGKKKDKRAAAVERIRSSLSSCNKKKAAASCKFQRNNEIIDKI